MEKGKKNIIVLLAVILLLGCGFTENIRAEGTETQCSVTFVNEGNIIGMLVYEYNALLESEELPVATKPSDDNYTYKFKMWADDKGNQVVRVTDDITVYAVYSSKKIKVDVDKPDKDKPEKIEEKEEEKKPHKDGNKNDGNKNDNKDDSNRDDSNKDDSNKNDGNNDDSQRDSEQENKGSQSSEKDGDSQATTETAEIPSSQKADSESVSTQQVSTESETVDIPEQDIPEGAKEDNCTIHVIVMLLCLSLVCYTIARIVLAKKENEVEDENA